MCALGFQGKGYSPNFVKNLTEIVNTLKGINGDGTQILITDQADSICRACPLKVGQGCQTQSIVDHLDEGYSKVLGLKPGDRITWGEAKKRIKQRVSLTLFDEICQDCSWQSLGYCKAALITLKQETLKQG